MFVNYDFTVVILSYDRPHSLVSCIASIWRFSKSFPRIIVVHNPGKCLYMDSVLSKWTDNDFPIDYIRIARNMGVFARNAGFEHSWLYQRRSPYIVSIDDDVRVKDNWENAFLEQLKKEEVYATGPKGYEIYPDFKEYDMVPKEHGEFCDILEGHFWGWKQDRLWKIPAYFKNKTLHEEIYLQMKMRQKGLRFASSKRDICIHDSERFKHLTKEAFERKRNKVSKEDIDTKKSIAATFKGKVVLESDKER